MQDHRSILVSAEFRKILDQRLVTGADERFAGAETLLAELRIGIRKERSDSLGLQRAQTFKRPKRVRPPQGIRTMQGELIERRHDRLVALEHEELLSRIAPPAVGVRKIGDQLGWGLIQHMRLRARFEILVHEAPDAAMTVNLIEAILLDDFTQITSVLHPITFLDDPAIHIDEVKAAIWSVDHVDDAEIRITRTDELRLGIRIGDMGDAILDGHLGSAD